MMLIFCIHFIHIHNVHQLLTAAGKTQFVMSISQCCDDADRLKRVLLETASMWQEVKVIWQKAPHGGPIPRLGVAPGGRNLYHWIPGVGFSISVL